MIVVGVMSGTWMDGLDSADVGRASAGLPPLSDEGVVASGGGVRNPAVIAALRRRLHPAVLTTTDEHGLPADDKEVYLMALLGFLTWHQLPGVVPGATGSPVPRVLGRIGPGDQPMQLPAPAAPVRRLVVVPPGADRSTSPSHSPR